jgi:hypothetical protein
MYGKRVQDASIGFDKWSGGAAAYDVLQRPEVDIVPSSVASGYCLGQENKPSTTKIHLSLQRMSHLHTHRMKSSGQSSGLIARMFGACDPGNEVWFPTLAKLDKPHLGAGTTTTTFAPQECCRHRRTTRQLAARRPDAANLGHSEESSHRRGVAR